MTVYKDNWFKWFYDKELYSKKIKVDSHLELELSLDFESRLNFKEEFYNSIIDIKDKARSILFTGYPINYAIIRAYKDLQIPFKVYIPKFGETNLEHCARAKDICNRLNIDYIVVEIDLEKFFKAEAENYFHLCYTIDPKKLVLIKVLEMINEPVVGAFREPTIIRGSVFNNEKSDWFLKITEDDLTLPAYFYNTDKFIDLFFYRKELVSSYITSPYMQTLMQEDTSSISSAEIKFREFNSIWPNFVEDLQVVNYSKQSTSFIGEFFDSHIRNKVNHRVPKFIKLTNYSNDPSMCSLTFGSATIPDVLKYSSTRLK